MKVAYLKLVNFANILAAMKRHVVEIDFSKCKNRVVLLLGESGSGKSSILSHIHPYATTGSGDQRNAKGLLIKDKEAYKEIHYEDGPNFYIIKHFYTASTTKSYIIKNGKELNPNGNVSTFLDCVRAEFTLDIDFLKLMRLGSNAQTFLKLSALKRKEFTTELLDEVAVYNKLYKKMNDDMRFIKNLMKNNTDRINKINISSREDIHASIKEVENQIAKLDADKTDSLQGIAVQQSEIIRLLNGETVESIIDTAKQLKEKEKDLEKKMIKASDLPELKKLEADKRKLELSLVKDESKLASLTNDMTNVVNNIDSIYTRKEKCLNELRTVGNIEELDRLKSILQRLEEDRANIKIAKIDYSSTDVKDGAFLMKEIKDLVSMIDEFNDEAKQEVVDLYIDNEFENPERDIHELNNKITEEIDTERAKIVADENRSKVKADEFHVIYKPSSCRVHCPFEDFFNQVTGSGETDKGSRDRLVKLNKRKDYIDDCFAINSNIQYIRMKMEANSRLLDKLRILPKFKDIVLSLMGGEFYDESFFTKMSMVAENNERASKLDERISEVKRDLTNIKANESTIKYLQSELTSLEADEEKLHSQRDEINRSITLTNKEIERNQQQLRDVDDWISLVSDMNEYKALYDVTHKERLNIESSIESIHTALLEKDKLNKSHEYAEFELRVKNKELETMKHNLLIYDELIAEKKEIEEKYEDTYYIRKALSSSEGVPLLYIQLYMMDMTTQINEILDLAYDGTMEVMPFKIDETGFNIPYMKNGVLVEDINQCSQGEETFLSMSISSAFILKSIERYNILLLDEIDGALDTRRRESFLQILEHLLDLIGAEQVFMITHNQVFDSYPVDIVLTSDIKIDNYKNTNVIFRAA